MSGGRYWSLVVQLLSNVSRDQTVPSFCTDIIRPLFFPLCAFLLLALTAATILNNKTIFKDKRQREGTVPAMFMSEKEHHQMPQKTFSHTSLAVTRTHGPLLLRGRLGKRVLSFLGLAVGMAKERVVYLAGRYKTKQKALLNTHY